MIYVYLHIMNVRRTIVLSEETDRALRAYLGQQGMQKGDLSKFIEEAVTEQLVREVLKRAPVAGEEPRELIGETLEALDDRFDEVVAGLKRRTQGMSEAEVMDLVDEALAQAR